MKEFMLIMSGEYQAWSSISPEEKQRIMEKYYAFVNRLKRENRFKSGSPLKTGAVQLMAKNGVILVDGPYAETKEALNGYFIFEAKDQEEAVAIARDCPALTHGEKVEVYEMGGH